MSPGPGQVKPSRLRGREGGEVEVNRDCSECLLSTGAWSNGCCLLPSTQTLRCAGAGWWERFGIAVLSIVSDKVPLLRWGLDPRDPTDHYSDLLPCPHLQDTTSGYSGPKSTFSPSCYCPWLGLKSFPRKKWTVSDLGGCLRDEGRLQEGDMEKCAGLESLWQPLRRGSLQTHTRFTQAERGLSVHRDQ